MINSYAGIIINTGEDNYLTTADAYERTYSFDSQFINEQLALISGLPEEQMGLVTLSKWILTLKMDSCMNLPKHNYAEKYSQKHR